MKNLSQENAPIYEALERFRRMRIVPFDVPGHKHGRGNKELVELLGERCVSIDVNSMKPLDNLCPPGFCYQSCRTAGSRGISCKSCISDGRGNDILGAGDGTFLL